MLISNASSGTLSYIDEHCRMERWALALEVDGHVLHSSAARWAIHSENPLRMALTFPGAAVTWEFTVEQDSANGAVLVHSTVHNGSDRPIRLGKVWMLCNDGSMAIGQDQAQLVCLSVLKELYPRRVYRLSDPDCPRQSKVKTQFYNRGDGSALQVGFTTYLRANTEVHHNYDAERGITHLEAWCDFAGWELDAGATTDTETLILASGDDPCAQLEQWASRVAQQQTPRRWSDAPIGWVGWSWVDGMTVERYEDVALRNAAALSRRLGGYGPRYIWVSIANLAECVPGRWLDWNTALFPHGPHYLVRRLEEYGLKLGLWCAPFWLCAWATEQLAELQDALLRNDDGSPLVVRSEWQFGLAGQTPKAQRPPIYALDPSHPMTLQFLQHTFEAYRRWGIRYYMLDFLHAGAGSICSYPYSHHHDTRLVAGPEAYHHALQIIRQAAGDDTYFLSSTGPSLHNVGIMDAIRTGNDFGEGRPLYPDSYFYPSTFVINSGAFWTGPQPALQNQASSYYTHRVLYINDSGNVLSVDKPLPLNDAQIHVTIHALSGGPSMIGDDVDRIDESRLELIKKSLPRPTEVARPVRLFDAVHPDYPKVFHRAIHKPWGRYDVVAVYNFGADLLKEKIDLTNLGLDPAARYLLWEFWNGEYVGRVEGAFEAVVAPRSARVYRLAQDRGVPTLLGTDMHLLMGEMEIEECAWDEATMTLHGRAIRPAGETGNVYLHVPETLRVINPQGLWIAKDARDKTLVIRVALAFPEGSAEWRVRFCPLPHVLDMNKLNMA